jgi:L-amino acid N-acyltransferase YncA
MVRPADPARDAAACAAIYAPAVTEGFASFEDAPPAPEEMAARIGSAPLWLVAERDGVVAGWASAGPFHSRAGYRWAVSLGVYVGEAHRGAGVGRELYGALLPELEARRFVSALALISVPNPVSVALHESFGFERVALLEGIGYKAGGWRDVAWYRRPLAPPRDPPPEPS